MKWLSVVTVLAVLSACTAGGCKDCDDYLSDKQKFCQADFAMRVKVKGKFTNGPAKGDTVYTIKVKTIFRINQLPESVDLTKLHTVSAGPCSVNLTKGKVYVIADTIDNGTLRISSCQLTGRWDKVSKPDMMFYKNCRIEIKCLAYH